MEQAARKPFNPDEYYAREAAEAEAWAEQLRLVEERSQAAWDAQRQWSARQAAVATVLAPRLHDGA